MPSPPQMTRSCQIWATRTGFTAVSATWPTVRCWTAASPLMLQARRTMTSGRGAPTASPSRPPPSPLCPATPRSSTTWASTWTVWWRKGVRAAWGRPWGQWQGAPPQTSLQAAVRDTPTSPPAPPHGWTRWTIPSFESRTRQTISVGIQRNRLTRLFTFLSITLQDWHVLWLWVKSKKEEKRRDVT